MVLPALVEQLRQKALGRCGEADPSDGAADREVHRQAVTGCGQQPERAVPVVAQAEQGDRPGREGETSRHALARSEVAEQLACLAGSGQTRSRAANVPQQGCVGGRVDADNVGEETWPVAQAAGDHQAERAVHIALAGDDTIVAIEPGGRPAPGDAVLLGQIAPALDGDRVVSAFGSQVFDPRHQRVVLLDLRRLEFGDVVKVGSGVGRVFAPSAGNRDQAAQLDVDQVSPDRRLQCGWRDIEIVKTWRVAADAGDLRPSQRAGERRHPAKAGDRFGRGRIVAGGVEGAGPPAVLEQVAGVDMRADKRVQTQLAGLFGRLGEGPQQDRLIDRAGDRLGQNAQGEGGVEENDAVRIGRPDCGDGRLGVRGLDDERLMPDEVDVIPGGQPGRRLRRQPRAKVGFEGEAAKGDEEQAGFGHCVGNVDNVGNVGKVDNVGNVINVINVINLTNQPPPTGMESHPTRRRSA